MGYDTLLFDMDGVLLSIANEMERFRERIGPLLQEYGVTDIDEEDINVFLSRPDVSQLKQTCKTYGLDPATFWNDRENTFAAIQEELIRNGIKHPRDGIETITILQRNYNLGIVSNNQHRTVEFFLDHHDYKKTFKTHYGLAPTLDGLQHAKPNPYYLKKALDDLDTENALYIGDSETDLIAAERAGIDSMFMDRGGGYNPDRQPSLTAIQSLHEIPKYI
jgi:HAD superfamily hydrolase (TIGR01549 family)